MPQFNILLYSPTSTSTEIEVATKFSGQTGMIIELHNDKGYGTVVEGLDVSWLSRYREESEMYVICIYIFII